MVVIAWVAGIVAVIVAGWTIFAFNRLIRRRTRVEAGWAQIDVELKRRHDLIPNLVEAVRGAAQYERGVLERVTDARAAAVAAATPAAPGGPVAPGDVAARAGAEQGLTDALRAVFAVREAYPALTANANFLQLQGELTTTEERIAYARGYYNAAVAEYDASRRTFPSSVIASAFDFAPRPYFEADVASQAPVGVDLSRDGDAAAR
jgi:LemA protein